MLTKIQGEYMVSEEQKKEGKTKERESKCNQDEMCRTSAAAAITC